MMKHIALSAVTMAFAAVGMAAPSKLLPPKDPGVVNPERILYWMHKRGELTANATEAEKQAALARWTRGMSAALPSQVTAFEKRAFVKGVQFQKQWRKVQTKNGNVKTVKVLVVLVEFADVPHDNNGLSPNDTQMYYSDYSVQHYQDMLFKVGGYDGPNGEQLITGYDYYHRESGGSLNFTGKVYGWVTADNNAAYYGGNDPNNNDQDQNVEALIIEAVTKAVNQFNIDLTEYDVEDPYDRDNDGILDEPDGFIDHVMIYHSTMGEEAGGGPQGQDAIWSHRFYVNPTGSFSTMGHEIAQGIRLFGYTIQPIDAAVGVSVHEFGHDLGVPDEYDTNGNRGDSAGSPVGLWSLMAAGSWVGSIPGSQPSSFSPYARDYYQQRYGGNWVVKQTLKLSDIQHPGQSVDLVSWNDTASGGTNLLEIDLGAVDIPFYAPYSGNWQYYSGRGDNLTQTWSQTVSLPSASSLTLKMQAHWDIETDWDYVQVTVNGTPVQGNHTKANNPRHTGVTHYITGKSKDISGGAEPAWVELTFDLSAFAGQTITLGVKYVTDQSAGGYGFAMDNLAIDADGSTVWSDDAENDGQATMQGFARISDRVPGKPARYWIQVRDHAGNDAGLKGRGYKQGVLLWYRDENIDDNKVSDHPGQVFLGVVDADQTPITSGSGYASTTTQIRDAVFGLNEASTDTFSDDQDYTHPEQPQSGIILPKLGVKMTVLQEAADSSSAKVQVSQEPLVLTADFTWTANFRTVSFTQNVAGGQGTLTYSWDFGDGQTATGPSVTHTYAASGSYTVTMTVTDSNNATSSKSHTVVVAEPLVADFTVNVNGPTVTVTDASSGGSGLSYSWDFGDGSEVVTGSPATHTYTASGEYTITLTVTSDDQQQATATKTVTVSVPPSARFDYSVSDLTVTFTNRTTAGDGALSYQWDFGDGQTSTEASPTHTYAAAGTYTVTLTATDEKGQTDSYSRTITVSAPTSGGGDNNGGSSGGGGGGALWLIGFVPLMRKRLFRKRN